MSEGALYLSCGCKHTADMGDLDALHRAWTGEVCTRDPDNPFVTAEISGLYCDECWRKMEEASDECL